MRLATVLLLATALQAESPFVFREISPTALELTENGKPIFVYNFGMTLASGAPEAKCRSSYLHPVYAPNGVVITDDFPKDHWHHRGIFWAWRAVSFDGLMDVAVHPRFAETGWVYLTYTKPMDGNRGTAVLARGPLPVEDAIRIANDSAYGLSGAIHTKNVEQGAEWAKQIDSGMVHVNDGTINDEPLVAFGGEKASGFGRLNGKWALEEFTTLKWVSVQHKPRHYPFEVAASTS